MQLAKNRRSGEMVDFKAEKRWLQEQIDFLAHTMAELVDEEDVTVGYVGDPFPVSAAGRQKAALGSDRS
jgi:hypothetical protein